MDRSSSNMTGSSTNNSGRRSRDPRSVVVGIPLKCWCGADIIEKTSTSKENPYRRYYRCWFANANRLENDPHVFKWVDEAYKNEIRQLQYQVRMLEEELGSRKIAGNPIGYQHVVRETSDYGTEVFEHVEEMLVATKMTIKRMMAVFLGGFVLVVSIAIFLKK